MEVIESLEDPRCAAPVGSAVCWGVFDGVHRGHASLLALLAERALPQGLRSTAVVFASHPVEVLRGREVPRLTSVRQRLRFLDALGLSSTIVLPFDPVLARVGAEEFVERILVKGLCARLVVVGPDTRFGKDAAGDERLLAGMGRALGFQTLVAPVLLAGGQAVRSTRIRGLVAEGRVEEVAGLLGRPFELAGPVVAGDGRGRGLGFPTANLDAGQMLPARGVYAAWAHVGPSRWPSAVNVGVRPTFGAVGRPVAEAHLVGFDGDLKKSCLRLELVGRLRGERTFSGPGELVAQIRRDLEAASAKLPC